jgi:hypothetical protein
MSGITGITKGRWFNKFFADSTGSTNANGNYIASARTFSIKPVGEQVFYLNRMIFEIEDSAVRADDYGAITTVSIGVDVIQLRNTTVTTQVLTPLKPTKVADWGAYCYDIDVKTWGAGNEFLVGRWTFGNAGIPIILHAKDNDRLEIRLNDDFSGLVEHRFQVQGVRVG